jgi:hypothetical protein
VASTANSNYELTRLILDKVILPGSGVQIDKETKEHTCEHRVGLLWDDFKAHSKQEVKDYCKSLSYLDVEILPGGLTPCGQPLDKVINKVFKGHFRDLYDAYVLTAPIDDKGSPKPPSRQLLATWAVKAWDMIPEELVRKSWTACGYDEEDKLCCENETAIVAFSNAEVGTMVERICGGDARTNFESIEFDADPFFPEDDEDEVEEVFVEF